MIDQEKLIEYTEFYLKSLFSGVSDCLPENFDAFSPFGDLGIDSFRILKIIKLLEVDFGVLPKTLLFENFTINDLAKHFVNQYTDIIQNKFANHSAGNNVSVKISNTLENGMTTISDKIAQDQINLKNDIPADEPKKDNELLSKTPIRVFEKDLHKYPELDRIIRDIFDTYKNDGSVSRGTRNIAPNLFIGGEKKGYFNYSRSKNIILVYSYTGPECYFPEIAGEICEYARLNNFQLNLFTAGVIENIGDISFSSTPFGALQRILNLKNFSLEGSAMRRLRYQVSKFEKSGVSRTEEYQCGTNKIIDQDIARVIDKWCAARTMVNPLIFMVREEILAGELNQQHRLFLTYQDDVLQNVILVSEMSPQDNGYLMDLEFYTEEMPLGGLEFAIVNIIKTLVEEGRDVLSMGGTYGVRLEKSPNADTEIDKILDDLHKQNIFNDQGNLQFKNKFRPENTTIYLCRPVSTGNPDSIIDIIMMIADPTKMQTNDEENHNVENILNPTYAVAGNNYSTSRIKSDNYNGDKNSLVIDADVRSVILSEYGFNPLNIPQAKIEFDLKTDSWAQLSMPGIANHMEFLHSKLQQPINVTQNLKKLFPFNYFVLTKSGRAAENIFCQAWQKKGVVLQNLLFPTGIYHQIDKGFTPCELPDSSVFEEGSDHIYKGNLDLNKVSERINQISSEIAFVYIELSNNAAGGYPVSIEHLKQIKNLLKQSSIPLVIDGTRILENAQCLACSEVEHVGKTMWSLAREILSYADVFIGSLAKDFCINKGGIIAVNDERLFQLLQDKISQEGEGLDVIDKQLIAHSLNNTDLIESNILQRMRAVQSIWQTLKSKKVPIVEPVGTHCILIDVKKIPAFNNFEDPIASFVAWMYLNTGIRAGEHSVGMQKNTSINQLVRLAIPVGLSEKDVDLIAERLLQLFSTMQNIPELRMCDKTSSTLKDIHASYEVLKYHNPSARVITRDQVNFQILEKAGLTDSISSQPNTTSTLKNDAASSSPSKIYASHTPNLNRNIEQDIAIVGMSGRYPGAKNPSELWENLKRGSDCITEISDHRLDMRGRNEFTVKYRGGFIDDVDKFDAGFFNVSSKEAKFLDPQERLFLEVAWEAIEDAGYYPETLVRDDDERDIGVFVGAVWAMYQMLGVEEKFYGNNLSPNSFLWSIANRVSYWMNFSGPSLTLDTACSSSLTALNFACDAIRNGDCSAALVGGVNLDLHQSKFDINSFGGSLSKDGVCRAFGKGANGYVQGEGVAALYIKSLERAIKDGDNIYGVIKSSVVNHSGKSSGYTLPSPNPQTKIIVKALEKSGLDANCIGYIEAHGTGTELGDAIEISALTKAFEQYQVHPQTCAIGSIKPNIGHLEAASGIVGIQKILLQMKHEQLAPSLNSQELNENINFEKSPFYVLQKLEDWNEKEIHGTRLPRRASISAFGAGGTNTHVIIEHYCPNKESNTSDLGEHIFPLSARTEGQLKDCAIRLRDFVHKDLTLTPTINQQCVDDIAHTLKFGRKSFDHRLFIIAKNKDALIEKLDVFIEGKKHQDVSHGHVSNSDKIIGLLNRKEKQDFINLLLKNPDPRRLAELWRDGLLVDWQALQPDSRGKRVSLPTYPFADERYWISLSKQPLINPAPTPVIHLINSEKTEVAVHGIVAASNVEATDSFSNVIQLIEKYEFSFGDALLESGDCSELSTEEKAQLFVKQLFANQLNSTVNDVELKCNLMDSGITSMDMAQMTLTIKEMLDPDFSPTAFFECTSISSLSQLLLKKYEPAFQKITITKRIVEQTNTTFHRQPSDNSSAETQILHLQDANSELIFGDLENNQSINQHCPELRKLLLTGATGFLGIHILSEVLTAHTEVQVLCLVRAVNEEQGLNRLRMQAKKFELTLDESRISIMCGDINEPGLGLSKENWELCCTEVKNIIHASAHVNHIEGYATFRDSTKGMKEIIRLASTHSLKLIQFISSISGCTLKIGDEFSIFENEEFVTNGETVYGGYGQSKWVQEAFLKRAHDNGVPYLIYRFGELSGSSVTGLGQTEDMLHRLLQMRFAIGCKEKISSDVLDMLPVDIAAKLIVNAGKNSSLWNRIVHATHLKPYSFANLYRDVKKNGLQFTTVTRDKYLSKCYDFVRYISGINAINGFVLECVLRDAEGSVRNRKVMDGYFAVLFPFEQNNFKYLLETLSLKLPGWPELIDRYMHRWSQDDNEFMARIFDYQKWHQMNEHKVSADLSNKVISVHPAFTETFKEKFDVEINKESELILENLNEG